MKIETLLALIIITGGSFCVMVALMENNNYAAMGWLNGIVMTVVAWLETKKGDWQ